MNKSLINKSRWFWPWQDDKEEEWLSEMSRQGLQLQHPGIFGQYTFTQDESREYAYRLDFVTSSKKNTDYFQLFRDAGWEHIGEMGGWQYWRKEIRDGVVPEIFTDNESKIQKYQRLLGWFIIFIPIFIVNLVNQNNRYNRYGAGIFAIGYEVIFFVLFVAFMLIVFSIFKIAGRMSKLKRK